VTTTLHFIVRCLLVISLTILPLSSTLAYYQPQGEELCPEMMEAQHKHNQDNLAVNSINNCCDNVMTACDCTGASSCCSISAQHIVVAIIPPSDVVDANLNSQTIVSLADHYIGYIAPLDIQPPIL